MNRALKMRPELGGQFAEQPEGIVTYDIDPATGQPAGPETSTVRQEIFLRGTEPGVGENSSPDSDGQPTKTDPDSVRPAPTPRLQGDDRPRSVSGRPSFFKRLSDAIGFTSPDSYKPEPSPTPWSSAGLKSPGRTGSDVEAKFSPEIQQATASATPQMIRPAPTSPPRETGQTGQTGSAQAIGAIKTIETKNESHSEYRITRHTIAHTAAETRTCRDSISAARAATWDLYH